MKIKICGIKNLENLEQIVALKPDYLGFIFYPKSKRFMLNSLHPSDLKTIPNTIEKIGVFVNETVASVVNKIKSYQLNGVQLHGNETIEWLADFTAQLKDNSIVNQVKIIKAFGVDEEFNFNELNDYKQYCSYFLFDTKTPNYGGSGRKFNWSVLKKYDNEVPLFLSGGLSVDDIETVFNMESLNIHAIDMNSQLEIEPGLKDISKVEEAISLTRVITSTKR